MTQQWTCSGEGPGTHEACDFTTTSEAAAMDHFEATGHAVDDRTSMQDYPCRSCGTRSTLNYAGLCAPCATAQAEWGR
jgi:hypothetical protein